MALSRPRAQLFWNLYRLWLLLLFKRHENKDANRHFDEVWRRVEGSTFFLAGAAGYRNAFCLSAREVALTRLAHLLRKENRRPAFQLSIQGAELPLRLAAEAKGAVLVTVHGPTDAIVNRFMHEEGISWTTIVDSADAREKARFLGLEGAMDIFLPSTDTLLSARKRLREGAFVCADADYVEETGDGRRKELFMSLGLFEMAQRLSVPIVYAHSRLARGRVIDLAYASPRLDQKTASAEALALDFIAWLQKERETRRPWKIGRKIKPSRG